VYRKAADGKRYIYFYGVMGERIGPYFMGPYVGQLMMNGTPPAYFAGRRLGTLTDRLGSMGATYYPYGEEEKKAWTEDDVRFATYVRDSATGLDYAVNRYYSSIVGRFLSPDPYRGNTGGPGDPANPQSWNRYAYVQNDPVNLVDPPGLMTYPSEGCPQCGGGGPDKVRSSRRLDKRQPSLDTGQGGFFGLLVGSNPSKLRQ
jgi:RHS repeat-associated protein